MKGFHDIKKEGLKECVSENKRQRERVERLSQALLNIFTIIPKERRRKEKGRNKK